MSLQTPVQASLFAPKEVVGIGCSVQLAAHMGEQECQLVRLMEAESNILAFSSLSSQMCFEYLHKAFLLKELVSLLCSCKTGLCENQCENLCRIVRYKYL